MDESDEAITYYVAPSGDLMLHVTYPAKDEVDDTNTNYLTKTLIVSSTVMCLASPVWKAMLGPQGHFQEAISSSAPGKKEVTFPDDDVKALLLLLNIAHLKFDKVPKTMSFDGLLNLAVLCDKYDMVGLLRPWYPKWAEPLRNNPDEQWAFIAWTFGEQSTFDAVVRRMVMDSLSSKSGELSNNSGKRYGEVMPPGLLESIFEAREKRLAGLLDVCYQTADIYSSLGAPCGIFSLMRTQCAASIDKEQCDTFVLGSLIRGLKSLTLLPGPVEASSIGHYSVTELSKRLRALKCAISPPQSGYGAQSHATCAYTVELRTMVKTLNEATGPSGVLDSHLRHIREQAKK